MWKSQPQVWASSHATCLIWKGWSKPSMKKYKIVEIINLSSTISISSKEGNWWPNTSTLQVTLNKQTRFNKRPLKSKNTVQLFKDHLNILFLNCVVQTQWKVKLQLAFASKSRQTPCAALSYLPSEFPPAMVGSGFIKLEWQKQKGQTSQN